MKKTTFLILIFCVFEFIFLFLPSTIYPSTIHALTSTPSANIQDKIKSLVQENLATTEAKLQKEIVSKSLFGYSGSVKSVGTKNLTLEIEGDLLQVSISPTTSILKAGIEIKTSSIAIADRILVIGTKNKEEVLEAKRITVLEPIDEANIVVTKVYLSVIQKIDLKKKTFVLNIDSQDQPFTLSKKTTVKIENYKDGDLLLTITKKYLGKFSLSRAVKI